MVENNQRYGQAIVRNLRELLRSLSYRNAYNKLCEVAPTTDWSFFSYASLALYDGIFSHAIKVLDKHKDVASFFYLHNCKPKIVEDELLKYQLTIQDIEMLAEKLNKIRNKTLFHIDKKLVSASFIAWQEANMTGIYFSDMVDKIWVVLNSLHTLEYGYSFGQPIYSGQDIKPIIEAAEAKGIPI